VIRPRDVTLGDSTWPAIEERKGSLVLAVPIGSCEQHGPHLPLSTDTIVAVALCEALAAWRTDVAVAPPVAIGASGEHADFPGTLSIGTDALARCLTELVRSARGWTRVVVLVTGHGGNADALAEVARTARHEGDEVMVFSPRVEGGDAHAGRTETSLLLALHPHLVRHNEAVPGVTTPLRALDATLRAEGVRAVSPSGVLGDPRDASAEEGRRVLAGVVDDLCRAVDDALGAPR
jgi:mycofactocin precursor peptide peptidase